MSTQSAVQPAYVPVDCWPDDSTLVVGSGVEEAAVVAGFVADDVDFWDDEALDAELFAAAGLVVVTGVNVVAVDVCTVDAEDVGTAVAAVVVWLATAFGEVTLSVDEMDWAAGAAAAWTIRRLSPTAAVATVRRRAEIRGAGMTRFPPMACFHKGRYRWGTL